MDREEHIFQCQMCPNTVDVSGICIVGCEPAWRLTLLGWARQTGGKAWCPACVAGTMHVELVKKLQEKCTSKDSGR